MKPAIVTADELGNYQQIPGSYLPPLNLLSQYKRISTCTFRTKYGLCKKVTGNARQQYLHQF
jgi:hypothetical protein